MSEENDGIPPVQNFTPSVPAADSNYLDKIFFRDTSIITGEIDSSVFIFNYDAQKRLKDVIAKNGLNGTVSINFLSFYYYQNDTLPYKVTQSGEYHYYYFYDNMGRVVKDSLIDFATNTLYRVGAYSYGISKIFLQVDRQNIIDRDTFSLDARGNVTAVTFSSVVNGISALTATVSAVFDNKPNPYIKIPEYRNFIFSYDYYYRNIGDLYRANNLISSVYTDYSSGFPDTDNYYYSNTYYPNGLPKNVIQSGSERSNETFIYKAL